MTHLSPEFRTVIQVVDFTTIAPKPSQTEPASVVDSSIHTAIAMGTGAGVFQIGWWQHAKMDAALSRLLLCLSIVGLDPVQIRQAA